MPVPSSARRKDVETSIRSCLIACKGGVTITELMKDYKSIEGECLPFREFNYKTPYDFLNSLTDVVTLDHRFGEVLIQAITTEKTEHVVEMVAGQKPTKNNAKNKFKKAFPGLGGRQYRPHYAEYPNQRAPYYSMPRGQPPSRFPRRPRNYNNGYHNQPADVPTNTHNSQESSASENNVTVIITGDDSEPFNRVDSDDDIDYNSKESPKSITPPQRVEKPTRKPIARCLKDSIRSYLEDKGSKNKTDNLHNHSNGRSPFTENLNQGSGRYDQNSGNNNSSSRNHLESNSYRDTKQNADYNLPKNHLDSSSVKKTYSNESTRYSVNQTSANSGYVSPKNHVESNSYNDTYPHESRSYNDESRLNNDNSRRYNHESENAVYATPKKHQESNSSQKIVVDESEKKSNESENAYYTVGSEGGFITDDEDLDDWMDDWIVDDQTKAESINIRIKERLKNLMQNNPNGIWCAELPQKYLELSTVPLNYEELGFSSVREFASNLPEIFYCLQPIEGGDYKLYNAQKPLPDLNAPEEQFKMCLAEQYRIYDLDGEPQVFPNVLDLDTVRKLFPKGVLEIGVTVGQINVSEFCVERDYEEVTLSEVFTPSFFWIQLRKNKRPLKDFMSSLHIFYEAEKTKYRIPPILLRKGINVACIYARQWHRGIILSVSPDGFCLVHFYDYGTVKLQNPMDVYFLHRRFSSLPAQAIACGLYNIKPYRALKWDKHIIWKFIKKTEDPLIATIVERNIEENSMLVSLTDTQSDEDFHINDWLINEKYAEIGRMDIDLQNLPTYEESRLPKWDQLDPEDPFFSNNNNKPRPPPGFSPLSTIPEKSPNKADIEAGNFTENNNINPMDYMKIVKERDLLQEHINSITRTFQAFTPFSNVNFENSQQTTENSLKNGINSYYFPNVTQKSPVVNYKSSNSAPIHHFGSPVNSDVSRSNLNSFSGLSTDINEFFKSIPKLSEKTDNSKNAENQKIACENLGNQEIRGNEQVWKILDNLTLPENPQESPKNHENSINATQPVNSVKFQFKETNPFKANFEESSNSQNFKPSFDPFKLNLEENKSQRVNLKNFMDSDPAKTSFEEKKPQRVNLKNFMDSPSCELLTNLPVNNEPKTDFLKPNPDIFVFGNRKEEKKEQSGFNFSNNFTPVIDSCTEKTNQAGSKIFYESGPVMYGKNKTETLPSDSSNWKQIPPADVNKTESTVKTGLSFTINKSKSLAEKAKEKIDRHIASSKSQNKSRKRLLNDSVSTSNSLYSWNQNGVSSNQKNVPTRESFDWHFPNPETLPDERTKSKSLADNIFVDTKEQPRLNNGDICNRVEFPAESSSASFLKSTNPFVNDAQFSNSHVDRINETPLNSELSNSFENATNSSRSELNVEPPVAQNEHFVCLIYELESKNRSVSVINLDNQGWLITDEFVEAFTSLNSASMMLKLLHMVNLTVAFKEVDRMSHSSLLSELDSTLLNVPRDSQNKILQTVHLTPLKSTVKILSKLKIINSKEVNVVLKNKNKKIDTDNSVLNDVVKLISSYGNYLRTKSKI